MKALLAFAKCAFLFYPPFLCKIAKMVENIKKYLHILKKSSIFAAEN